jgi:hypothetical protein
MDSEVLGRPAGIKRFIAPIGLRCFEASHKSVSDEIGQLREQLIENNDGGRRTTADSVRCRRGTIEETELGGWRYLRTSVRLHCRDLP